MGSEKLLFLPIFDRLNTSYIIMLPLGLTGFAQDTTTTVALVNPKLGLGWSEGDISAVIIL
jgi:hypothetical protein